MPLGVSSLVNCSCEPMLRCPWAFKVMLPPLYEAIWEDVISRLPANVMHKAAPAGEIEASELFSSVPTDRMPWEIPKSKFRAQTINCPGPPICSPRYANEEAG